MSLLFEEVSLHKESTKNKLLSMQREFVAEKEKDKGTIEILKSQNEELEMQLTSLLGKYESLSLKRENERNKLLGELEIAYCSQKNKRDSFNNGKSKGNFDNLVKSSGKCSQLHTENNALKEKIQELKSINNTLNAF